MFYMLEILQDEIKKNVDALIISMKESVENESINENSENLSNADDAMDDTLSMDNLESAKNSFLDL